MTVAFTLRCKREFSASTPSSPSERLASRVRLSGLRPTVGVPWRRKPLAAEQKTRPGARGAGRPAGAWHWRPRHRQAMGRSRRRRPRMRAAARQAGAREAGARRRGLAPRSPSPIPTIPRCGRCPLPGRGASGPWPAALAGARALGSHKAEDDLKNVAYPHCAPARAHRHRQSTPVAWNARAGGLGSGEPGTQHLLAHLGSHAAVMIADRSADRPATAGAARRGGCGPRRPGRTRGYGRSVHRGRTLTRRRT
jgi:hypothetical protein